MKTSNMILSFRKPLVILCSALSFLAACKKDKDSNETPAVPATYYAVKGTEIGNNDTYQLVSIDAASLTESVIYNLKDSQMNDIAYSSATKEVLGLGEGGYDLIKINPATKQKTIIALSTELNIWFKQLMFDNANNLYSLKYEGTMTAATFTLVKIDVATGKVTALKPWKNVNRLSYLSSTNELVGLNVPYKMAKYNLNSGDTSTVTLTTNSQIWYYDLFTDSKSGLYAFKMNDAAKTSEIVKLDASTNAESTVTALSDYKALQDAKIIYNTHSNEIVGLWNDVSLYRYDVEKKTTTTTSLTTDPTVWYDDIITN